MGAFPQVRIAGARQEWSEARRKLASGVDPSLERKKAKLARYTISEDTFRVVAEDWFETKLSDKSESHRNREYGLLKNHLYPALGDIPVAEITAPVLLGAVKK